PIENVPRYRLLNRVTRLLGTRVTRSKVAPIMLGKTILTDTARRADVDRFAQLMGRRRDIWRAVNGVVDRGGVHHELGRIRSPTLVLVGDEDVATPRAKAERIAGAIASAKLVAIPRAGHPSPVEEPELVTAASEQ